MKPKDILKNLSEKDEAVLRFVGQLRSEESSLKEKIALKLKSLKSIELKIDASGIDYRELVKNTETRKEEKTNILAEETKKLRDLSSQLSIAKNELDVRKEKLNERETVFALQKSQLDDKEKKLGFKDTQAKEELANLEKRKAELEAKESTVSAAEKKMNQAEIDLAEEKSKIETSYQELSLLGSQAELRDRYLDDRQTKLDSAETDLTIAKAEYATDKQDLIEQSAILAKKITAIKEEYGHVYTKGKELDEREQSLDARDESTHLKELEIEVAEKSFSKKARKGQLENLVKTG